jgi:regulatory protein
MNTEYDKAMKKAMDLLSRRAHSHCEILRKLRAKGFSESISEDVVAECERLNFINDSDFAEYYLEELKNKGYGILKIKNAFYRKGIFPEIFAGLLNDNDDDEFNRAEKALELKIKSLSREPDFRKRYTKACRFLFSRGFTPDIARKVVENSKIKNL